MMIERWNKTAIYYVYYQTCQPIQCLYIHETKYDMIYVITTLLSLTGGLITLLKLLIPCLVRIIRKRKVILLKVTGKKYSSTCKKNISVDKNNICCRKFSKPTKRSFCPTAFYLSG
jgi:hypothetical protein